MLRLTSSADLPSAATTQGKAQPEAQKGQRLSILSGTSGHLAAASGIVVGRSIGPIGASPAGADLRAVSAYPGARAPFAAETEAPRAATRLGVSFAGRNANTVLTLQAGHAVDHGA